MMPRQKTMQDVAAVCRVYRVSVEEVMSPGRKARAVLARQAVMWMLRFSRGMSFPQIGALLRRNHSTVVWGIGRHDERIGAASTARNSVKTRRARYRRTYIPKTGMRMAA